MTDCSTMDIRMLFMLCVGMLCCGEFVQAYTTSSGTVYEGSSYTFSCNSGYFIDMISATYYRCYSTSSNVLSTLETYLDGYTSRTLTISDSLFGLSTSGCTGYIASSWYCGRNGGWSDWGTWSDCTILCGGGVTVTRSRSCNNPSYEYPGAYCSDSSTETQECNTQACDDDAQLVNHRGPWTLVYKAPAGTTVSGYNDYYSHFADSTSSSTLNDGSVSVMRDFSSGGSAFKSSKLLQWESGITISAVRLSVYKNGEEAAYVIFDARGKGKLEWFDCNGIIGSSYTDIASYSSPNYCGFAPYSNNYKRNFYINAYGTGCTTTYGWIMFKDYNSIYGCSQFDPATTSSPYVKYSTSTTLQNFYSGSVTTGDSLAIFIMEWHMVFKGVQGVTPTAGSLLDLWTGSTVENDNDDTKTTITTSPGDTVKSSLVEDWEGYFTMIDMVKYAYFTSGEEMAYVVFDGRGTSKTTWFADGKEMFSSYTDVTTDTPTTSGISGDSYRKFALIRTSSTCASFYGWMMVLDVGGIAQCSFDNNVQTRPYFLYSSSTTDNLAQSSGSWYSAGFPAAHTMGIFVSGFYPVMKWAYGQSISPATSVYNLWAGTHTLNEFTTSAHSFAASTSTYKSSIVDSWTSYYIKAVRVSMYKNGAEVAYVVFDAHGSDKTSWFDCDRILYTNYQDLNRRTGSFIHCSVVGDSSAARRFFIEYTYDSCTTAGGWIGVMEGSSCGFDNLGTSPFPLYSDTTPGFEYNINMAIADVFVISVAMEDFCDFSPCLNGGTCYHRGVKYECVCAGAYYGLDCADLDGNFTTWTDWGTCSTTCYAWGTHSRTRTCTNPTPAGPNGQSCTGDTSETQDCIADLDTCSVYNTGNIQVDSTYRMVCRDGLYISVSSAFYGYYSTCYDSDPLSDVRVACHGQNTNCTITFNDATFGGNPCSSYSVTKYGYATMYCVESLKLSTFQGPWRLVFKAPSGTAPPAGHADIASFYLSSDTLNDGTESVMTDFSAGGSIYKSGLLNEWGVNKTFSAVRYSIYKNGVEVAYIVFNGQGTSKDTWMNCDNILYSSYTDIRTVSKNYCVIEYTASTTFKHNFYISATHGGCSVTTGWVFLKDYGSTSGCSAWGPYDGSRTEPYIAYSTLSTLTTWDTGGVDYADSLAIFVQDWHMVFKGVDGVTPSAGNLETLWEGTTTEYNGDETVKTISRTPAVSYKSAVVEEWSSNWTIIDQVKYSFASSGTEVAHVVFDGINTDKNSWFSTSKILFSSKYDSVASTATSASISTDGTRTFSVVKNSSSCAAFEAWMLVLDDASGSTTCSFDNNVRTRPYFLYSSADAVGAPESSSSWDSVNFPYAETLGIFIQGWLPIMKVSSGSSLGSASGIYDLWTGTYTLNEYVDGAYSMSAGTVSFKSSIVDSWNSYYKQAVRVGFYTNGEEQAYVVFDAHASSKTSWFSCNRILYTSFADLTRSTSVNYCSITGNSNRYFFLEETYGSGCSHNFGWFAVVEGSTCSWDSKATVPFALHSDAGWSEANDDMVVADTFAISISRDAMCGLVTCQNGATCYDWGSRWKCVCAGNYYGGRCQNLDGGWTDWTAWTDCSTTCYAQGTQTRERTCTNPSTAGDGVDCTGNHNLTEFCIPSNLDICSSYNTSDIAEGDNYTLACPSQFYFHVYTAYYGAPSIPCVTSDPLSSMRTLCHGDTGTCNVIFSDANFGGDPCASYPSAAKVGYIEYFCAKSQTLDEPRGPWRLVFKAPRGTSPPSGYTDIMSLYSVTGPYNEGVTAAMTDFSASGSLYKSAILDQWGSNLTATAVRLSVYTNGVESAYVTFDATGKGKNDWFDCSRIIDSSWNDIESGNTTCELDSSDTYKRIFHIKSDYSGCNSETGWIMFKDYGAASGCSVSDSTSTTMPYILYSSLGTRAVWGSGDKATGDCLAIFLMDWHTAFKAVAEVQTNGSLVTVWTGSDSINNEDESALSITNSPAINYKSSLVESWSDAFTFIDMVKYAYFTSGLENAWIVFNGIGTTKSNWFSDSRILFSSYSDILTAGKSTVSITGDGTRSFAVIYNYPSCSGLNAWMMMLDYGSSTTCSSSFDNAGTKPYFLYSSSGTYGQPESSSSWDSSAFPKADVMGIFINGWFPVLKVGKGSTLSPASGIYDLWNGTYILNEYNESYAFSWASNSLTYKSSVVDGWANFYIKAVRVSFFVSGTEQAYVVFDAHGTTKMTWFSCDRILYSSWTDLNRFGTKDFCSIEGEPSSQRYFFMQSSYGTSCATNNGWFSVVERSSGGCSWEQMDGNYPHVVFSDTTTAELNTGMAVADTIGISISMDDVCDVVECLNGATCLDWGGRYLCSCAGNYYGHLCQNLDGAWTAWSDWTDCSTTCYSQGIQTRIRYCTNPPLAGDGLDCSGIQNETLFCTPTNLDLCAQYNTSFVGENENYTIVCPSNFYIHIYEAYYGSDSIPCSTSDPVSSVRAACHGGSDSCNVIFSDTFFGGDPCSSYPSAVKSGYIIYNCARSKTLDQARGPWRLVFKVPSGTSPPAGYSDIMALYSSNDPYNEGNTAAMTDFSPGGSIYKSSILNQWGSNLTATAVKVAFFKSGFERAFVVFDASGKGKNDWFDQTRIIDSNWIDIETGNTTCELNSGDNYKRVFQIKSDYTGCSNETGWFMMKDYGATDGCSEWDTTSTTMPYMYYSNTGLRAQWSSADKELADSFAIFLMDWHMVFKAVSEVQTDGSLETVWTGSSTINDNVESAISVTNTPASNYKSSVVEAWSEDFTFIDMVKYAYFTGGVEKAWIVFDGVGTSKTTWYSNSKILFSSYSDIQIAGKTTVSITGDGIRSFATIYSYPGCSGLTGWMMMSDYGSSTTCSFDNAGTKPYFLYSNTGSYGLPQSASSWDSTNFPKADVLGIFIHGWFPVMKVSKSYGVSPAMGIYDLWNNTYTVNEYNDTLNAFSFADNTIPYKSSVVDSWDSFYIKAVRLSFIVSGTERAYVVFDAHGSTKLSWFSCERILYSSWTDLNNEATQEYCSIQGNEAFRQHFLMHSSYGTSCATNSGWFSIVERSSGGCSWEQMDATYPHVVYSDTTTAELNTGMAVADTFAVSVSMDDICDIVECQNGATCFDWGGRYMCSCEGQHYGHLCQNIDGNYTSWTDWTDCSTSCYATGTQSRYRNCTNPTPLGIGLDCTRYGVDYEVQFCVPTHLDICNEYNTGDIPENGNYTMVCPSSFYIHVYDAFYGNGTTCSDSDALSNVRTTCHGQTDSCILIFNYATFGTDPCSSYAYLTNYGYATFYCAKQQQLDDWKGPWRLVFKVPRGAAPPTGYSDIMSLYTATGPYNEGNTAAMTDFSASGALYKSALLDQWGDNITVNAVKLSVFANGSEVAYVVFDASSSTKSTWFDQNNIIASSWHDIVDGNTTTTFNSGGTDKKVFYISSDFSGCDNETGWIMMKDYGASSGCTEWDTTSMTMPYIYYSGLGTRVQWSSADRIEADVLAISIIDWHMVFKAVESVTPTGSVSLESLWTGSDTENDLVESAISVTNTPANVYKSSVVEAWSNDFTFIDMVKYSYFTGGVEKAWIVFDGVGTTKSTWFADSKILFSKYTDILIGGKTTVSISGDSTRAFAVIYQSSSCSATTGWMMLFDYSSSYSCSAFEREGNVATKPYFLYSNTDVYGYPQWSSSWDSTNFPKADVMGIFIKGWFPVLKVARGMDISPATGIYDLWTNTYTMNEYNDSSQAFSFASNTMTYKSSLVDTWSNFYIKAVRVSFFVSGTEQAYVVFDATGSNKTTWFSCDRILYTSWTDLGRYGRKDYCSVAGDSSNSRFFAMLSSYGSGCTTHNGWFVVSEAGSGCSWETQTSAPFALYSDTTTLEFNDGMAIADVFAVSVSMDNICDIVTCENGATCRDWGVTYSCLCEGDHYGWLCQNIDGNYTSWTDWSDCTTTCYAEGTHYRTRTCTNPTPLGIGQDCVRYGEPLEILRCIPTHLDICSEYNTGEVTEDTSYYMVCPTGFYIHVYAASYGNGSTCFDANALEDLRAACHMQTDTCNVTFSDTFFSGDPCTSYPGAVVTGSAKFYCAKRRELDTFRGPWRLAFKVPSGTAPPSGYTDIMALYDASGAYNEFDTAAMTDFSAGGTIYKSTMLDNWGTNLSASAVKLSVFKDGKEMHYVVFNAVGKGKTDWFDCNNIIETSWHDLQDGNFTCTKSDGDSWKRNFFIKSDYTSCTNETGWFVLKDYGATDGCTEWDTTSSLPQIWYSQTGFRVQWAYGNKTTADAMAIFLMDWHMVFKGVEEVTPAAGTMANLWNLEDTENDNDITATTLTKSPNVAYKSSLLENWADPFTFIDMVKYAFFTNGLEKTYTIFDGRNTTKTTWFASGKILFSQYTDISSVSIGHCSISSDSRRRFLIAHDISTTCTSYKAWMFTQDVDGATYCSFDNSVYLGKNRPNFLYSEGTSYGLPQPSWNWDNVNFPSAEVMGVFIIGWYPLMKVAKGVDLSPALGIHDLWTGNYTLNEYNDTDTAFSFAADTMPYKSHVVDSWSNYYIKAVRVSFFVGGVETAYVVFDAHGTDKNSWFDCDRVLYTSWTDVSRYGFRDYCSVMGDYSLNRTFFLSSAYGDSCSVNSGWFGVIEHDTTSCAWEQKHARPFAIYSDATTIENYDDMAVADVFAVSMSKDSICDIVECDNGGTCYDWGARYRCYCPGYFYGWLCQNLDGNWTTWADWSACSTSCYAIGTQYRYRNCTEPAPVGHGLDCGYPDLEVQTCVPDHDVCPEYNTGDLSESKNYTMICPVGYYIYVDDAFYGNGSICYTADAINRLRGYCHGQTDSCQFFFTDSYFGGDPCSAYPGVTKYGNAKLNCIKRQLLDTYQGAWRLVFKAAHNQVKSGHADVKAYYDATASDTDTDAVVTDKTDFSRTAAIYKSSLLDDWGSSATVQAVRLSVWKDGKEVHYVVFDTFGKTKSNWMECDKILYSSWHDLTTQNISCQIREDNTRKRTFYLSRQGFDSCTDESGWLIYKDVGASSGCSEWDTTSNTMPYIKYATGTEFVTWASDPLVGDADALAIFVMDWYMAFKGVQGVSASTGSLESLWVSEETENYLDTSAQTTSTAPGLTFKSSLLGIWSETFTFIEMVKYAFFSNGAEVAFTIFDGRNSSSVDWFANGRIILSSYDDIVSQAKTDCSIAGDGYERHFAILKQGGATCTNVQGWMLVSENSSQTCVFDRESSVETAPFFLYSSSSTYAYPQSVISWDSAAMPAADVMGVFVKGWFPAFHIAVAGSLYSASSVYDLFTGTYIVNEYNETAFSLDNNAMTFKSNIIDSWTSYYIQAVRVSFFKDGAEAAYVVFDAHGSNKTSWFDCNRILYSSYDDLTRETPVDYCSVLGDTNRRFFLEASYGLDCAANSGWFGIVESTGTCPWETLATTPYAMYSDAGSVEENAAMAIADNFVISVAMDNICSTVNCLHGATCDDQGGRYDCICDGYFYGWLCQHLDGNWTAWSDWDTCSTTCYAEGGQNRYRNCTNPAPVGDGLYCPGVDIEFQYCIPDLPICASYDTGNIQENGWYHMVCPSSYYIYIWDNFYGFDEGGSNECKDPDSKDILFDQCHNVTNGSCRFFYDDATYSDPCNKTYSQITNYGHATLYCARDGVWNAWQAWSFCTVTCGGGTRYRERVCDNPTQVWPGNYCPDVYNDSKSCKPQDCPVCGDHYAGYDEPSNITVFNDTRSGEGYLLLDVNWDMPCCEVLQAFEFVPRVAGEIYFHVWRKFNSLKYELLHSTNYTVNDTEIGTAINHTLILKKRLSIRQGDFFGWYTPGENMIKYAECCCEGCPNQTWVAPIPASIEVGDKYKWTTYGTKLSDVAYAIRFFTAPNTVPYVNQTEYDALVPDNTPLGGSCINYHITDDDIGDYDLLQHEFTDDTGLFELNTTFPGNIHIMTRGILPSTYSVFDLVLKSWDDCGNTATTTLTIMTYNAPPIFINLPDSVEVSESVTNEIMLFEIDVVDQSENDSVCCTLTEVIPGSLNFQLKFENEVYKLYTSTNPVFNYKDISDYYKVRFCCSDDHGLSTQFLEIFILDVEETVTYVPPTWFITAIACSMVPICVTFLFACMVLCNTVFCDSEIEYYYE